MYLELLKRTLTRAVVAGAPERHSIRPYQPLRKAAFAIPKAVCKAFGMELVRVRPFDPENYLESGHAAQNRLEDAETMIGLRQLDNLQVCITDVIQNNVPGDILEAGVWRGGASIFMRGVLCALGQSHRRMWLADSFSGLPEPDPNQEVGYAWSAGDMAISLEQVKANFARYGLLDEGVSFVKGFFSDTLPGPVSTLAVLRIDADLFGSTQDALNAMYPKLSPGGYAIFDDYLNLPDCRRAIDHYRGVHGITDQIQHVDRQAIYWQKSR